MSDDLDKFTLDELLAARHVADANAISIREVLGLPPDGATGSSHPVRTASTEAGSSHLDGATANAALAAMRHQIAEAGAARAAGSSHPDGETGAAKADSRNGTDFLRALDRANAPDLKPVDGAAFLAADIPPPDWIIPDFMAKHYQGALFGKSKSRKSFFAIQLGLSVACGVKCLGFPAPERPRRVAYFNLELMPRFLQERMKAQTDALGLKPERGFFTVYNLRGRAHLLRDAFTDADGNAVTESALTRQLRDNGTDFVVVDPRYKLMQGAEDENSAQGLRALLDFRTALADVCAVLLVGHDPKGDVSSKSLLDRGAGSYTAMADDDCTILLTPNGYDDNAVTVETVHRNRAPVPPFAALFDGATQTFTLDPNIPVETARGKTAQGMTPAERAQRRADTEAAFKSAALAVAEEAGGNLLGKRAFKSELAKRPETAIGSNLADDLLRALVERGDLAETPELERKPDGTAKPKYHGVTFISTPERIAAYRESFGA